MFLGEEVTELAMYFRKECEFETKGDSQRQRMQGELGNSVNQALGAPGQDEFEKF